MYKSVFVNDIHNQLTTSGNFMYSDGVWSGSIRISEVLLYMICAMTSSYNYTD